MSEPDIPMPHRHPESETGVLNLAMETRLKIYRHLLIASGSKPTLYVDNSQVAGFAFKKRLPWVPPTIHGIDLSILLTCKLFYQEGLFVLYGENDFVISPEPVKGKLMDRSRLRPLSIQGWNAIRHVGTSAASFGHMHVTLKHLPQFPQLKFLHIGSPLRLSSVVCLFETLERMLNHSLLRIEFTAELDLPTKGRAQLNYPAMLKKLLDDVEVQVQQHARLVAKQRHILWHEHKISPKAKVTMLQFTVQ